MRFHDHAFCWSPTRCSTLRTLEQGARQPATESESDCADVRTRRPLVCLKSHVQAARKDSAMARRNSLFRHILVPHDFSEQATVALTTAGRLAKAHGGKLSVLYVLEPFYWPADVPFGMPTLADLVPEQKRLLEQLVMKTLGRNRPPCTVRVEIGEAARRIINAGHGVDCIVMATS